ncbi:MAG TPA: site-2 protease family protein [Atribacterota bacterium]|nr:site-2 protease family protein [Atribacterota bacterium]HPK86510.1 site-2 protease family protein [Atribacterota bacterium]
MLEHLFSIIWSIPAVLAAITVHEYAHGLAAYYHGDPTAKLTGRLTLNPLAHLDPIGTLMLLLFRIGWAKPVPINYNNLKNPKMDMIKISLAGPLSNIITAFIFALLLRMNNYLFKNLLFHSYFWLRLVQGWYTLLHTGIFINIALAFFNLIPVPPLDGHHIISGLLPERLAQQYDRINQTYGMIIILFLFVSGIVGKVILPVVDFFYRFFI